MKYETRFNRQFQLKPNILKDSKNGSPWVSKKLGAIHSKERHMTSGNDAIDQLLDKMSKLFDGENADVVLCSLGCITASIIHRIANSDAAARQGMVDLFTSQVQKHFVRFEEPVENKNKDVPRHII